MCVILFHEFLIQFMIYSWLHKAFMLIYRHSVFNVIINLHKKMVLDLFIYCHVKSLAISCHSSRNNDFTYYFYMDVIILSPKNILKRIAYTII